MGIDRDSIQFLLWARENGADFERPLTLGRMGLHLSVAQFATALGRFGIHQSASEVAVLFAECAGYAEPFFKLLGATHVDSVDRSAFEGATLVHDLNRPVPADWHERYSVVYDGGTLEHVFDYPTALRSCLNMVAVGGHFITVTPANNYMGHGFYQFSPELYARVFHEENGFTLEKMIVFEVGASKWFEVIDPAKAGGRVSLVNDRPTMLGVWARRTRRAELFAAPPQQSDYSAEWCEWTEQGATQPRVCRESTRHQKPWLLQLLRAAKRWIKPRYPAKFYRPVDIARQVTSHKTS